MRVKNVLAISDISCVGKCALTVALPVISALGIEVSVLPTALLSTHTGGFSNFYIKNLSFEITEIIKRFKQENFKFDCIYSGYLSSVNQIDIVLDIIDEFKASDGFVVVDPAMADNGKLYANFDKDFPSYMLKLCGRADFMTPNITESLLLTNSPKFDNHTVEKLSNICKNFAITSVIKNGQTGVFAKAYNLKEQFFGDKIIDGMFHGAGDLFASAVTGCLLNGLDFLCAVKLAEDFVYQSIVDTKKSGRDTRLGLLFERNLPDFIKSVFDKLESI